MKMWIARDANDKIYLHKGKPTRTARTGLWESYDGIIKLGTDDYPEVTFENSPMEVELKLIEK